MIWSLLNRGCIAYLFYYFIINTYLHSDNWLGASFRTYVLQSNSVGRGGRGRPHNRTQGTKYKHQRAGSSHLRQDNHLFVQAMFMFYSRCTGCLLVLSFSLSPPLFYRKSSPSLFSPPRSSLSLSLSSSSENSLLLSISASVCTCADLTPQVSPKLLSCSSLSLKLERARAQFPRLFVLRNIVCPFSHRVSEFLPMN